MSGWWTRLSRWCGCITRLVEQRLKSFKNLNGNRSRFLAELASEDPQLRAEAYGRGVAGLAFTVTGLALTANGNLTGGGPKDYKQRKLLEEAGWRPYSIKVGDDYISYQRMDPFASMLGIFADMSDINRYAPPGDASRG